MGQMIKFPCFKVMQPIGVFYVGVMNSDDLVHISYADRRRLDTKEREIETYLGIQRPLSDKRVKELQDYVNTVDASFPSSIILHISSEHATFHSRDGLMEIDYDDEVAKILDGQHRIAGLENFQKEGKEFQTNVTIFIDMDIEDQALLFATINLKQEKVSKSLAYDLYDFASHRSPQKTAHNIAKLLNKRSGNPFYDKIKILGQADDKNKETITQSTFVENLMKYISKNPMWDRDLLKRGKKLPRFEDDENKKYFLRDFFIDEKDAEIAKIISNYFMAVMSQWKKAWETPQSEIILNRSTGFIALMKFMRDSYLEIVGTNKGKIPTVAEFQSIFKKIKIKDDDFNRDNFKPGGSGISELYRRLKEEAGIGN